MEERLWNIISGIREQAPLVHNITNYVVMNNTANALLAAGASPVMAHAPNEVRDMMRIANALVINIGTLSDHWIKAMREAMEEAEERAKPIVFDPVGVGATPYRNRTVADLLTAVSPTVIRANGSEIRATVFSEQQTKGVDSTLQTDEAEEAARMLVKLHKGVVCISGAEDAVISQDHRILLRNGHPMMGKVTGTGCMATALIAAALGVHQDAFEATAAGMALIGVAGQLAANRVNGPASLQIQLIDKLHNMTEKEFKETLEMRKTSVE